MKKISILFVVFLLLLLTCTEDYEEYGKFWAADFSGQFQTFYRVDAKLLAENDLCYVWADKNSGVNEATAQQVAKSYKNSVYDRMLDVFGYKIKVQDKDGNDLELNNIQYANWLAKGDDYDGKLTILLLDIKDNYKPEINDSYVAGYFWAGNLYEGHHSNKCDMIYVDSYPGFPGSMESNETLSHELQHLMNFAGTVRRGKPTDLWIDEGLSVTAEWVYSDNSARITNYNNDVSGLLKLGNNFFIWGNREGEGQGKSQYAVLDDYSTAYLFFRWLGLQSDKKIYGKINASGDYDYKAVINAFNDTVTGDTYKDWEAMLKDWLAANYYKNPVGRYGYRNDPKLNNIRIHYAPGGSTNINLFPGEGVYSRVSKSTSIPIQTGNIYYSGLTGFLPVSSGSLSSGALLTYNANTYNEEEKNGQTTAELGIITGEAPPPSVIVKAGGRSAGTVIGPFPISAGDMLRQNGNKGGFNYDGINYKLPDAYRGIIVHE